VRDFFDELKLDTGPPQTLTVIRRYLNKKVSDAIMEIESFFNDRPKDFINQNDIRKKEPFKEMLRLWRSFK